MRLRVHFEIAAEGVHAPQQALAVVEPVDADELVAAAERAAHARVLAAAGRRECEAVKTSTSMPIGKAPTRSSRPNAETVSPRAVPPSGPPHVLLEAAEVLRRLESDEVVGEQRAHQRLRARAASRGSRSAETACAGRSRCAGARRGGAIPRRAAAGGNRAPRRDRRGCSNFVSAAQSGVDAPISLELAALEASQVDAEMQQRPQAVVAEAVVVAVELLLRQVERRERQPFDFLRAQPRTCPLRRCARSSRTRARRARSVRRRARRRGRPRRRHRVPARRGSTRRRGGARGSHERRPSRRDSRVAALMMPTSE